MKPPSRDLSRAVGKLVSSSLPPDDPPSPNEPYRQPIERFLQVPSHTRALLQSLKEEDTRRIAEVIDEMRDDEVVNLLRLMSMPVEKLDRLDNLLKVLAAAGTVWGFGKWMIASAVAVLIAVLTLGEKFSGFMKWWATGVWK